MYKLISLYRSSSPYSANARIIQITHKDYVLYIQHDVLGLVRHCRGSLSDMEKELFSFIPYGYTRPFLWKKVLENGN